MEEGQVGWCREHGLNPVPSSTRKHFNSSLKGYEHMTHTKSRFNRLKCSQDVIREQCFYVLYSPGCEKQD